MALDLKGSAVVNLGWSETKTRNGTVDSGTKAHGDSARIKSEARMQSDCDRRGSCSMGMGRLGPGTFST